MTNLLNQLVNLKLCCLDLRLRVRSDGGKNRLLKGCLYVAEGRRREKWSLGLISCPELTLI